MKRKLIEVALPLEKINEESEREKHITQGHPATLHMWWARRPLATSRAIIWASLVDDPSSHPELFPTEEDQNKERNRLFKILEELVVWENSNNKNILDAAKAEVMKSTGNTPPALLDPFSGGGAIPLEAQRLGLKTYAHDLNPVAVMINKAMLDYPSRFCGRRPVNPESSRLFGAEESKGANCIADDLEYYGEKLKIKVFSKVNKLYPQINYNGEKLNVVAWIWARTVKCSNPACSVRMPLIRNLHISNKKRNNAWIDIVYEGKDFKAKVHHEGTPKLKSTIGRKGAVCACCGTPVSLEYIRSEGRAGRLGEKLVTVIADGKRGKVFLSPTNEQELSAKTERPKSYPDGEIAYFPGCLNTNTYGFDRFSMLFTDRQITTLSAFSETIPEIVKEVENDAIRAGYSNDHISLKNGGNGAFAYAQAIQVYLAFAIDKMTDYNSSVCTWHINNQQITHTFGRQAIPMSWDIAEANPFSGSSGSLDSMLRGMVKCIRNFESDNNSVEIKQFNAQADCGLRNIMVSTDPPYYNNIDYSDIADFFYIWMRKSLSSVYPELFSTLLTPKSEELIAMPFRFGEDVEKAKKFFENGMLETCKRIHEYTTEDIPVTIYYAYKQTEQVVIDDEKQYVSSGWETMLSAIIEAGFTITGTWPVRTEKSGRLRDLGSNALATSIVLVCRKRPDTAGNTTRRNLINILRRELKPALKKLQESNIAPVDLAQSAIGPGMGVFSRYKNVLESDGTPMNVRNALKIINDEIDLFFNEQVSDLDAMSRFCVDLYTQSAFNDIKFGEADVLARAKGTSVESLAMHDVVYAKAGIVHLTERTDLPVIIDINENCVWKLTQQLTQAMTEGGVEACAKAIFMMLGSNAEKAKDLAYRLYTIAEQKKWSNEAFAYNALVVAWPDIQSRAAMMQNESPEQLDLFSTGLLNT